MRASYRVILLLFLSLFAACSDENNPIVPPTPVRTPPTIASVNPTSGSLGESKTGKINGTNFNRATSVSLGDGVTVLGFTVVSATQIEVTFRVNLAATPGKKDVTVTTPDGTGVGNNLFQIINNRVPTAKITVFPERGAANTIYTIDALGSDDNDGAVVNYVWNFGDNKKASGAVVRHQFGAAGTFVITLTITDNEDAKVSTQYELRVEKGTSPEAKFIVTPKTGDLNTTFTFDASSSQDGDGRIREFLWNFGNGKTQTGMIVQQNFKQSGLFTVELTVTDNRGLQGKTAKQFTVGEFDQEAAAEEIRRVIESFFRSYSRLTELSAEQIVANFSTSPNCKGRAKEINVVNNQKQFILDNEATIIGEIEVSFLSSTRAQAVTPGHFEWTEADGFHQGNGTHTFTMTFENEEWFICDFTVKSDDTAVLNMLQQ